MVKAYNNITDVKAFEILYKIKREIYLENFDCLCTKKHVFPGHV